MIRNVPAFGRIAAFDIRRAGGIVGMMGGEGIFNTITDGSRPLNHGQHEPKLSSRGVGGAKDLSSLGLMTVVGTQDDSLGLQRD
jgi:hypothetical protein